MSFDSGIKPPEFPRPSSSLSRNLKARLQRSHATHANGQQAPQHLHQHQHQNAAKPASRNNGSFDKRVEAEEELESVINFLKPANVHAPQPKGYGEAAFDDASLSLLDTDDPFAFNMPSLFKPYASVDGRADLVSRVHSTVPGSHELSMIYQSQGAMPQQGQGTTSFSLVNGSTSQQSTLRGTTGSRLYHGEFHKIYDYEGLERIAASLADSSAEFCYLEVDPLHPYKFKIIGVPAQLQHNRYFTLTKRGIVRHSEGELTSFKDFIAEQELYNRVVKINIFRRFKLWRPFAMWKFLIKSSKRQRATTHLQTKLLYLCDPSIRDIMIFVKERCDDIRSTPFLRVESDAVFHIDDFVQLQRSLHATGVLKKKAMLEDIMKCLCSKGEEYIQRYLSELPPVISTTSMSNNSSARGHKLPATVGINTASIVDGLGMNSSVMSTMSKMVPMPVSSGPETTDAGGSLVDIQPERSVYTTMTAASLAGPQQEPNEPSSQITAKPSRNQRPLHRNISAAMDSYLRTLTSYQLDVSNRSLEDFDISYTEKATIRSNCRKLARLVLLIDFMIRDAWYDAVEHCIQKVLFYFTGLEYRGKPRPNVSLANQLSQPDILFGYRYLIRDKDTFGRCDCAVIRVRVNLELLFDEPQKLTSQQVGIGELASKAAVVDMNEMNDHYVDVGQLPRSKHYGFAYEPTQKAIRRSVQKILLETMTCGCYLSTLLHENMLLNLFLPISSELNDIHIEDRVFMDKDNSVHMLSSFMNQLLVDDFAKCSIALLQIEHICHQYEHNVEFQSVTTLSSMLTVDQMNTEFVRLGEERAYILKLPDVLDMGLIKFEYLHMKRKTVLQVDNCLQLLHFLIPEYYLKHAKKLYDSIFSYTFQLSSKPQSLAEFVKVVGVFNECVVKTPVFDSEFSYIIAIQDVMSQYQISKSSAVENQGVTLSSFWKQYNTSLNDFKESLEANIKAFEQDLKAKYKALLGPIDKAKLFLMTEDLKIPTKDCDVILSQLQEYMRDIASATTAMLEIEHFQSVLNVNVCATTILAGLEDRLKSFDVIWNIIKAVQTMKGSLFEGNFFDCNIKYYEKKLYDILKSYKKQYMLSINGQSGLDGEIIAGSISDSMPLLNEWLDQELSVVQEIIPLITKLQYKFFLDRHRKAIEDVVKSPIYEDFDLSVSGLLALRVLDPQTVNQIDAIFQGARCEHNVHLSIQETGRSARALEFAIHVDPDNKAIYYIDNLDILDEHLDDIRLTLLSCRYARHAEAYHETIDEKLIEIEGCVTHVANLRFIQMQFTKLRVFFTSSRTARYLSSSLKHFKIVDEVWRLISKILKDGGIATVTAGSTSPAGVLPSFVTGDGSTCLIMALFQLPTFAEQLSAALLAIDLLNKTIASYVDEQRAKWPKLFLIDKYALLDIFATQEPRKTFHKSKAYLFPYLSDLIFDSADAFNNIGAIAGAHGSAGPWVGGSGAAGGRGTSNDNVSIVGSGSEIIKYLKPLSARSSLVDWFKSIDTLLTDRLHVDIKELIEESRLFHDEIRNPRASDQARIVYMQARFWKQFLSHQQLPKDNRKKAFRAHSQVIIDMIGIYSSMMSNGGGGGGGGAAVGATAGANSGPGTGNSLICSSNGSAYQLKAISNTMLLLISQRDFLQYVFADIDMLPSGADNNTSCNAEMTFLVECSIKKVWNAVYNTIRIRQGPSGQDRAYGMRYLGIMERLVITPQTERFYFAITSAMSNGASAQVVGPRGSGKTAILQSLAHEYGADFMNIDCPSMISISELFNILNASVGCGMWTALDHIQQGLPIDDGNGSNRHYINSSAAISILVTAISTIMNAIAAKLPSISLNGAPIKIWSSADPRGGNLGTSGHAADHGIIGLNHAQFIIVHDHIRGSLFSNFPFSLPASLRRTLRPVTVITPDRKVIIHNLLLVYNYSQVAKLALRLDEMCEYMIAHDVVSQDVLLRILTEAIRCVGTELLLNPPIVSLAQLQESPSTTLGQLLIRHMMSRLLPVLDQDVLLRYDAVFLCNLFVDGQWDREKPVHRMANSGLLYSPMMFSAEVGSGVPSSSSNAESPGEPHIVVKSFLEVTMESYQPLGYPEMVAISLLDDPRNTNASTIPLSLSTTASTTSFDFATAISTLVVGDAGIGKSSVIAKGIAKALADYNKEVQLLNSTKKRNGADSSQYFLEMVLSPGTIDPFALSFFEAPSTVTAGMSPSSDEDTALQEIAAASQVLKAIISKCKSKSPAVYVFHIDVASSHDLADLVPRVTQVVKKLGTPAKLVWECCDLAHVDPSLLPIVTGVVHIAKRPFDVEDIIQNYLDIICARDGRTLRLVLSNCIDAIVKPCILFIPSDSFQRPYPLLENFFRLFNSLYEYSGLTTTLGNSRWNENTVKRIAIYACIWTFGVCSPNSRKQFDGWFKATFDTMIKKSAATQAEIDVFPFNFTRNENDSGGAVNFSLFDCHLYKPDADDAVMVWWHFEYLNATSEALRSGSSADSASAANLPRALQKQQKLQDAITLQESKWFRDCYYTTILSNSPDQSNLRLPSSSSLFLNFTQSCMLANSASVSRGIMILGESGCMKSTLMHSLIDSMRYGVPRWICHTNAGHDLSSTKLITHMKAAKQQALSTFAEKRCPRVGAIFVDDISLVPAMKVGGGSRHHSASVMALLRSIWCNDGNLLSSDVAAAMLPALTSLGPEFFVDLHCVFTSNHNSVANLLSSVNSVSNQDASHFGMPSFGLTQASSQIRDSSSNLTLSRFMRHNLVVCCEQREAVNVFCSLMINQCPAIEREAACDLVHLTFGLLEKMKLSILGLSIVDNTLSSKPSTKPAISAPGNLVFWSERDLLAAMGTRAHLAIADLLDANVSSLLHTCSLLHLTHFFISKTISCVQSIPNAVGIDAIKCWDRVASDYFQNVSDSFATWIRTCQSKLFTEDTSATADMQPYDFQYPSFENILVREQLRRMEARQQMSFTAAGTIQQKQQLLQPWNSPGFSRVGKTIVPDLWPADYFHEAFITKCSLVVDTSPRIDTAVNTFWADTLSFVAQFTNDGSDRKSWHSISHCITVSSRGTGADSIEYASEVLQAACQYLGMSYKCIEASSNLPSDVADLEWQLNQETSLHNSLISRSVLLQLEGWTKADFISALASASLHDTIWHVHMCYEYPAAASSLMAAVFEDLSDLIECRSSYFLKALSRQLLPSSADALNALYADSSLCRVIFDFICKQHFVLSFSNAQLSLAGINIFSSIAPQTFNKFKVTSLFGKLGVQPNLNPQLLLPPALEVGSSTIVLEEVDTNVVLWQFFDEIVEMLQMLLAKEAPQGDATRTIAFSPEYRTQTLQCFAVLYTSLNGMGDGDTVLIAIRDEYARIVGCASEKVDVYITSQHPNTASETLPDRNSIDLSAVWHAICNIFLIRYIHILKFTDRQQLVFSEFVVKFEERFQCHVPRNFNCGHSGYEDALLWPTATAMVLLAKAEQEASDNDTDNANVAPSVQGSIAFVRSLLKLSSLVPRTNSSASGIRLGSLLSCAAFSLVVHGSFTLVDCSFGVGHMLQLVLFGSRGKVTPSAVDVKQSSLPAGGIVLSWALRIDLLNDNRPYKAQHTSSFPDVAAFLVIDCGPQPVMSEALLLYLLCEQRFGELHTHGYIKDAWQQMLALNGQSQQLAICSPYIPRLRETILASSDLDVPDSSIELYKTYDSRFLVAQEELGSIARTLSLSLVCAQLYAAQHPLHITPEYLWDNFLQLLSIAEDALVNHLPSQTRTSLNVLATSTTEKYRYVSDESLAVAVEANNKLPGAGTGGGSAILTVARAASQADTRKSVAERELSLSSLIAECVFATLESIRFHVLAEDEYIGFIFHLCLRLEHDVNNDGRQFVYRILQAVWKIEEPGGIGERESNLDGDDDELGMGGIDDDDGGIGDGGHEMDLSANTKQLLRNLMQLLQQGTTAASSLSAASTGGASLREVLGPIKGPIVTPSISGAGGGIVGTGPAQRPNVLTSSRRPNLANRIQAASKVDTFFRHLEKKKNLWVAWATEPNDFDLPRPSNFSLTWSERLVICLLIKPRNMGYLLRKCVNAGLEASLFVNYLIRQSITWLEQETISPMVETKTIRYERLASASASNGTVGMHHPLEAGHGIVGDHYTNIQPKQQGLVNNSHVASSEKLLDSACLDVEPTGTSSSGTVIKSSNDIATLIVAYKNPTGVNDLLSAYAGIGTLQSIEPPWDHLLVSQQAMSSPAFTSFAGRVLAHWQRQYAPSSATIAAAIAAIADATAVGAVTDLLSPEGIVPATDLVVDSVNEFTVQNTLLEFEVPPVIVRLVSQDSVSVVDIRRWFAAVYAARNYRNRSHNDYSEDVDDSYESIELDRAKGDAAPLSVIPENFVFCLETRSDRAFTPSTSPLLAMSMTHTGNKYAAQLRRCVDVVLALLSPDANSALDVHSSRIKWLCVLAHAAIIVRLDLVGCHHSVSEDTLLAALRIADALLHAHSSPRPQQPSVNVVEGSSSQHMPAVSGNARLKPEVFAYYLAHTVYFRCIDNCSNSNSNSSNFSSSSSVAGHGYGGLLQTVLSVLLSYFCTNACDASVPYAVQGTVPVPTHFHDADATTDFLRDVDSGMVSRQSVGGNDNDYGHEGDDNEGEYGYNREEQTLLHESDYVGATLGEVNNYFFHGIRGFVERLLVAAGSGAGTGVGPLPVNLSPAFLPSTSLSSIVVPPALHIHGHDAVSSYFAEIFSNLTADAAYHGGADPDRLVSLLATFPMSAFTTIFQHVLSLLPETIDTNAADIAEHMLHFGHSRRQQLAGGGAGGGGGKGKRGGRNARGKAANALLSVTAAASGTSPGTDFDPLWAFALSECYAFNKSVESWRRQLSSMLDHSHSGTGRLSVLQYLIAQCDLSLRSSRHRLLTIVRVFVRLSQGFVPASWLTHSLFHNQLISGDTAQCLIRLEDWFGQLHERRAMIHGWLTRGYPGLLKLHLLHSPHALLHAMKESFVYHSASAAAGNNGNNNNNAFGNGIGSGAVGGNVAGLIGTVGVGDMIANSSESIGIGADTSNTAGGVGGASSGVSLERLGLEATVISGSAIADGALDLKGLSQTNFGCSILISGLQLHNAAFSDKPYGIELGGIACAGSSYSQDVAIQLAVVLDLMEANEDDYACPVVVHADFPATRNIFHTATATAASSGAGSTNRDTNPSTSFSSTFIRVPITTIDSAEDCRLYRVAIYSCPKWRLPSESAN